MHAIPHIRKSWLVRASFWWKSIFIVFLSCKAFVQWLHRVSGQLPALIARATRISGCWRFWAMPCCVVAGSRSVAGGHCRHGNWTVSNVPTGPDAYGLMTTGLAARMCAHPHYRGVIIVFWAGIALIGPGRRMRWLAALSASADRAVLLVTRISGAPLLDQRLGETRRDYAEYRRNTPGFLPTLASLRGHRKGSPSRGP